MSPDELAVDIIVDLLETHTGQRIAPDRRWRIQPALSSLFRERKIDGVQDLIVRLTQSDDESLVREVVEALLNNETYFFRDRAVFDHLQALVLPQLAEQRRDTRRLNIWSVGCSTGQEPLSIAMCLAERRRQWADWQVKILATDVSQSVINFARQGCYSSFQIQRGLGVSQMLQFFSEKPRGWQALDDLTDLVCFEVHNVLETAPTSHKADLILCRNVLMYFDDETRMKALQRLAEALAPDGFLVLGGGEVPLGEEGRFEAAEQRHGIYRLRDRFPAEHAQPAW